MVLDAARAAHIPGVGTFGSGFLSDPTEAGHLEVRPWGILTDLNGILDILCWSVSCIVPWTCLELFSRSSAKWKLPVHGTERRLWRVWASVICPRTRSSVFMD